MRNEWLETDGLGGFAMGTDAPGLRTRRYHGLLVAATDPPAGRTMLVNAVEAWLRTPNGLFPLSSHRYEPGVTYPGGADHVESFTHEPWPRWVLRLPDGTIVEHELFMPHGRSMICLSWKLRSSRDDTRLFVRPLISGRDYHQLHRERGDRMLAPITNNGVVTWQSDATIAGITVKSNGRCMHDPLWFRNFLLEDERERGFDCIEDLASPGVFEFDLSGNEAALMFASAQNDGAPLPHGEALPMFESLRRDEHKRRAAFASPLHRVADQYIVARGNGRTIIAGYPWFADWGRDTFIAMRGLCLATGRLDDAKQILLAWRGSVSQGMLPNRYPDSASSDTSGGEPEYNAVDASLWFVIAAHEFLSAAMQARFLVSAADARMLRDAMTDIMVGYIAGTRFGIRCDTDGLLMAGEPGQQLTWMDARVGDREITPRIGKPVEIQALWINALRIVGEHSRRFMDLYRHARQSFQMKFWNAAAGSLYDVIDVDHLGGKVDATIRPNQIFAVGGLPMPVLDGAIAAIVVDTVERELLTPIGLRSLARTDVTYVSRYEGGPAQRDGSYHQGTVWPWLMGAFVEAWVRVRESAPEARREAHERFVQPMLEHLETAGLGHVSEIADGDSPHTPRGCPFQAWSVGELLRLEKLFGGVAPGMSARQIKAVVS